MQRLEIINALNENYRSFTVFISSLEDKKFEWSNNKKWTAGQQLDHIYRSVKPLALIFSLPKIFIRLLFGKANRPSRTYDELVQKYQSKLAAGGKASGRYIPKEVSSNHKDRLEKRLLNSVDRLASKVEMFSEQELDTYIIPHPLLGKLTLREMLYFTIYHVAHHQEGTEKNLKTMS